ncbi:MAG: exodeoxyribonuclease III [Parcubacteria group bacterium]
MKIITWNVNGLRAVERKGELEHLIAVQRPDFLLLQEIKGKREQFSSFLTEHESYEQFYHSAEKPGYAGTGVWMHKKFADAYTTKINFNTHVPDAPNHDEGRMSHLTFTHGKKIYDILSIYFPNGGKSPQAWKEKLIFFDKVLDFMNDLRAQGHRVIVGGDMNVAHEAIDLARPKENDGHIGFHPDERAWMDHVIADKWVDVWRAINPSVTDVYSWWDSYTHARDRNVGWRIDYFFIDKKQLKNVQEIAYLNEQYGSDHCPLLMDFKM